MKQIWKPGTMIYPLPAVLVGCGSCKEDYNLITVAWTGTICTNPPMCYISVRPERHSYELIKSNMEFTLNLTTEAMAKAVDWCGVRSGRDYNKFDKVEMLDVDGIKIIKDCIAYMYCEVVDVIDADTHTVFIGKVVKSKLYNNEKPMSYSYYSENKDTLIKRNTEQDKVAWVCTICGYVYYGEEIPDDFVCPVCGVTKEFFKKK